MSKARDRDRDATQQVADLSYLIWRQWWRPWKNRQRRAEMTRIIREADQEARARQKRRAEFREAQERRRHVQGAE